MTIEAVKNNCSEDVALMEGLARSASGVTALVGIATYNRNDGLKKLLQSLKQVNIPPRVKLEVLVVDNSTDGNAGLLVASLAKNSTLPIAYRHEQQRGISHARNAALQRALEEQKDFLLFIDDDETPGEHWLTDLYATIRATNAGAVSGGVRPRFSEPPAWWITKGKFLEISDFPDSVPFDYGHTSNVIIDLSVVARIGLRFDPTLSFTGGEDTAFFAAMRRGGASTVFRSSAYIYEDIVPDRASLRWLMKRWFRTGNTDGVLAARQQHFARALTSNFAGGLARLLLGGLGALLTSPLFLAGSVLPMRLLRVACRGGGFLISAMGVAVEEYRNPVR